MLDKVIIKLERIEREMVLLHTLKVRTEQLIEAVRDTINTLNITYLHETMGNIKLCRSACQTMKEYKAWYKDLHYELQDITKRLKLKDKEYNEYAEQHESIKWLNRELTKIIIKKRNKDEMV